MLPKIAFVVILTLASFLDAIESKISHRKNISSTNQNKARLRIELNLRKTVEVNLEGVISAINKELTRVETYSNCNEKTVETLNTLKETAKEQSKIITTLKEIIEKIQNKHVIVINRCNGVTCQNDGACEEVEDGYQCKCKTGFSGKLCEDKDYCHGITCQNEGICEEITDDFQCNCKNGFAGKSCESVDRCSGVICVNGGKCENGGCKCPKGFTGDKCKNVDHCVADPCNGEFCVNVKEKFLCMCPPSKGKNCERYLQSYTCSDGKSTCRGGPCIGDTSDCDCPALNFRRPYCSAPYQMKGDLVPYEEAVSDCAGYKHAGNKYYMASVADDFLKDMSRTCLRERKGWVGITKTGSGIGKSAWRDRCGNVPNHNVWAPGEPKDENDCAILYGWDGLVYSVSCNDQYMTPCLTNVRYCK